MATLSRRRLLKLLCNTVRYTLENTLVSHGPPHICTIICNCRYVGIWLEVRACQNNKHFNMKQFLYVDINQRLKAVSRRIFVLFVWRGGGRVAGGTEPQNKINKINYIMGTLLIPQGKYLVYEVKLFQNFY